MEDSRRRHVVFLTLLVCWSLAEGVDYTSPLVFDAEFYVNSQSLWEGGVNTETAAKHHWVTKGLSEGLQGCGSFHSKQYLLRYPDLQHSIGNDYQKAVEHYLAHGHSEKKLGYLEGGYAGRWTISNGHDLFISASGRTAGAIDSVVWNNKEFINSLDHGRQLQMATNTNPWGECFNPTEAGSRHDRYGHVSTSQLKHIAAHDKTLESTVHPAFWLRHNDHEQLKSDTAPCANNHPALNTEDVYPYPFSKKVTIGCAGLDHCIKFESTFTIGGHWPDHTEHNLEGPTGYLTGKFTETHSMDPHTFHVGGQNFRLPLIMSTPDHKYAMGIYAPDGQDTDQPPRYNGHTFSTAFAAGTCKWGVGFRKRAFPDNTTHTLHYTVYICIGDTDSVVNCLHKVIPTYRHV